MKPPPFEYHAPTSVDETCSLLGSLEEAKVLAGGQSLVPLLNFRLARPAHLIDINRIDGLDRIYERDGGVAVQALARQAAVEDSELIARICPLLKDAMRLVAHRVIRNRGTVCGSLAHADPAAELPAVLALVAGSVTLASAGGRRDVPAAEFFVGPLESAVRPGELAVEATFPVPPPHTGTAWLEISRRRGDYAVCGVGVLVTLSPDGLVAAARAAYVSVGPTPVAVDLTEAVAGQPAAGADWAAAGALAASRVEPEGDIHATAAYRRHLVAVLTARAGRTAVSRV